MASVDNAPDSQWTNASWKLKGANILLLHIVVLFSCVMLAVACELAAGDRDADEPDDAHHRHRRDGEAVPRALPCGYRRGRQHVRQSVRAGLRRRRPIAHWSHFSATSSRQLCTLHCTLYVLYNRSPHCRAAAAGARRRRRVALVHEIPERPLGRRDGCPLHERRAARREAQVPAERCEQQQSCLLLASIDCVHCTIGETRVVRVVRRVLSLAVGAVPSPFDCYLLWRGVKTLHVRMRQHEANATALALAKHPLVRAVNYPGVCVCVCVRERERICELLYEYYCDRDRE